MHRIEDLIAIFKNSFFENYNTLLVKGDDEPLYLPANDMRPHHQLFFAHGFFSSALHECAHWLIAGPQRRLLEDFGYWYAPEGRSAQEQALFQQFEVKPQALEWILATAAQYPFRVSIDNFAADNEESAQFKDAIFQQVGIYCEQGLPQRAKKLFEALCDFYQTPRLLNINRFERNFLDAFVLSP